MKNRMSAMAVMVFVLTGIHTSHGATLNFEADGRGQPRVAPTRFEQATALRDDYASIGIGFSGTSLKNGGAILDTTGPIGLTARSGSHVLAFDPSATLLDGGVPTGTQTITFDQPIESFEIYAWTNDLVPAAFTYLVRDDKGGVLNFGQTTAVSNQYVPISVTTNQTLQGRAFHEIRITATVSSSNVKWAFDDLSFGLVQPVPEPASLVVWGLILTPIYAKRHPRQRR